MNTVPEPSLIEETDSIPWLVHSPGVEVKRVAPGRALDKFTTTIYRLAPNAVLPDVEPCHGVELIVLDGELQFGQSKLESGSYARRPAPCEDALSSATGCTIYVKSGLFHPAELEPTTVQPDAKLWRPGHGQLEVKPLHEFEGMGCALVRWPAGERFIPHRHWGGEEIFVLSGTFEDEHGRYPTGTWIQSPHQSQHHPFVREETVIFVRTGHLPMAD